MRTASGDLQRVHAVLVALSNDPSMSPAAIAALNLGSACSTWMPTEYTPMYTLLYETAEQLNPYKGAGRRKRCRFAVRKFKQCAYAYTFYLLSEGLYDNVRLPDLASFDLTPA